jgi:hypothetical protein
MPFLALVLPAVLALAQPPPFLCVAESCTARMREIARGFEGGRGITLAETPLLASGECYHLSPDYDPETTHYGIVLLDPHEGAGYMSGVFGFFFPENPYRGWTAEQMRKQDGHLYAPNRRVDFEPGYAYADMNPGGEEVWLYWLKRSDTHLYVVGQWGTRDRFYCALGFQ